MIQKGKGVIERRGHKLKMSRHVGQKKKDKKSKNNPQNTTEKSKS